MFTKKFQHKYALTDQGVKNTELATFWTLVVNLVVMGGVSILYYLMIIFMGSLTESRPISSTGLIIISAVIFVILSYITH